MRRPARIDQVIPTIIERDAVSGHTREAQRVLRSMGFESEIYAQNIGPGLPGKVRPIGDLPEKADGSQWVLYQSSIGSPVAEVFAAHPARKLLNYHNITPAVFLERWVPVLGDEVRLGRQQLVSLAPLVSLGIAVSSYNESELVEAGYQHTTVAPLLVDMAGAAAATDRATVRRLEQARASGGTDWLFVGQVSPHKSQHDVISAFAFYRRVYDPKARLHLVGRDTSHAYAKRLQRVVAALGLEEAVDFAGIVGEGALAAHYAHADVLVCCSEHEGYCAPLLEAMHHGLPVIAYGAAAVPETVAGAGIVLPRKSPDLVAAAVNRVVTDDALRRRLVAAGHARAASRTIERARAAFVEAVERALAA